MRFLMTIIIFLIFFSVAGIGAYVIGPDFSADRMVAEVTKEMRNNGQMEKVIEYVESDPKMLEYIEQVEVAEQQDQPLPFQTAGDAAGTVIKKVGITDLAKMKSGIEDGTMSVDEVIQTLEQDLNEEELLALKVIAYKELYKQQ
ncbi:MULTISPECIES: hypothetical protein [Planococcus]|uniref:Phenylalanyl-tRNA synthetase subunit beta n=1 Tax=Planococcus faecalis TaxID=1598147 RepID=A0ABN4XSD6_9BACL|nr:MULTISPECIES: hypothetical protein [Planococcus]AQU79694.1 hypothetical protein AJGP001_10655 [Planococcus faecalis]KAA0958265.1 hypothetical protein FQ085_00705 [Planococcus sp. ANT_H30]MDJ0331744.1 hypothetical protein [Planococcus sp. S3-L1]